MFKRFFVLGICFLAALPLSLQAKRYDPLDMPLPKLEVMPGAQSQWVGQQMAHNGMPMSVRLFTYPGAEADVKKYYQSLFKTKGHGKSQYRNLGEYRVIGFELRGYIYSVQYRQIGRLVEGKLTVTPMPGRYRTNKKTKMAIAPGCRVLNKVESLDYGKRSETLTLTCQKALNSLEYFYLSHFEREQWSLIRQSNSSKGVVLDYQRGSETVQVTLNQSTQKSKRLVNILINWIK
ncbi:MAG: hypothetical protein MI867_10460 [Pseudomonadales bacterium]|nr:hypothetical protein [Pseudomonadales bacterium]